MGEKQTNSAPFKRANLTKIVVLWNPDKNPNERWKTEFSKNIKN